MDFDELEVDERLVRRKLVEEWLDKIIEAYNDLGKEFNPDDEPYYECPRCINVHPSDKEMQITNAEKLARYASIPLTYGTTFWKDEKFNVISFMYKGYGFYEWQEVK